MGAQKNSTARLVALVAKLKIRLSTSCAPAAEKKKDFKEMDAAFATIHVHCLHNFICSATFLPLSNRRSVDAKSDYVRKFD